ILNMIQNLQQKLQLKRKWICNIYKKNNYKIFIKNINLTINIYSKKKHNNNKIIKIGTLNKISSMK
ncbi:hypothetical protein Q0O35_13770, partial [Staphylococcus aureus]|nr:hypothetical protein [Staphylococcus aureus]